MRFLMLIPFLIALSGCGDMVVAWESSDKLDNYKFIRYYEQCSSNTANRQDGILNGKQFRECIVQSYNLSHSK